MTYWFEIETAAGVRLRWTGLTKATAVAMYRGADTGRLTDNNGPALLDRYGWGVED